MTKKPRSRKAVETALVTAFVIATAFIWKDVILNTINQFVPAGEELFYQFLTATIATIVLIIAVYLIFKTEEEAEFVIGWVRRKR